MSEPSDTERGKGACPICRRQTDVTYRPFCSKRCADVDLSRWLSGAYVIAGKSASDDGEEDGFDLPPPDADFPAIT